MKLESEILVATNLLGRPKWQNFLKERERILLSWICVTKCVLVYFTRGWMPFFLKGTVFGYDSMLHRHRNSICKMSAPPTNSEVTQGKVTRGKKERKKKPKTKAKEKSAQDSLKLIFPKRVTQLMLKEATNSFLSARILPETAQIHQWRFVLLANEGLVHKKWKAHQLQLRNQSTSKLHFLSGRSKLFKPSFSTKKSLKVSLVRDWKSLFVPSPSLRKLAVLYTETQNNFRKIHVPMRISMQILTTHWQWWMTDFVNNNYKSSN